MTLTERLGQILASPSIPRFEGNITLSVSAKALYTCGMGAMSKDGIKGDVLVISEIDDGRRERSSGAQSNQTKISLHPTRWQGTVLN